MLIESVVALHVNVTMAYGHIASDTVRTGDTSAPVPKCPDTSAPGAKAESSDHRTGTFWSLGPDIIAQVPKYPATVPAVEHCQDSPCIKNFMKRTHQNHK